MRLVSAYIILNSLNQFQCVRNTTQDLLARDTLREGSSQTNVILQYKLLASILSAVCSVIQQS